ncbi:MAG: hypothetical protein NTY77_10460 [Elusimicrobia bacterium]|nr:hypothetical protein [Elusimicrobiota bacterium]
MRLQSFAFSLVLLAPALAAAQTQPADQQPAAAATSLIQPGAIQGLSARFFGNSSALDRAAVPPAGAAAPVKPASQAPLTVLGGTAPRVAPDWSFTPGKLCSTSDPDFKEFRYAEQIPYCKRHVTQQMKQEVAAHYGVAQSEWHDYEFDHLIPLSIGGNSHVENLWPQPHGFPDGSNGKDRLEMKLYLQMKGGSIRQAAALGQIQLWFQGQSEVDGGAPTGPPPPGDNPAD